MVLNLVSVAEGLNDKLSMAGASLVLRGTSGIPGYRCLKRLIRPKTRLRKTPLRLPVAGSLGLEECIAAHGRFFLCNFLLISPKHIFCTH